jgi:hypothetical protein
MKLQDYGQLMMNNCRFLTSVIQLNWRVNWRIFVNCILDPHIPYLTSLVRSYAGLIHLTAILQGQHTSKWQMGYTKISTAILDVKINKIKFLANSANTAMFSKPMKILLLTLWPRDTKATNYNRTYFFPIYNNKLCESSK